MHQYDSVFPLRAIAPRCQGRRFLVEFLGDLSVAWSGLLWSGGDPERKDGVKFQWDNQPRPVLYAPPILWQVLAHDVTKEPVDWGEDFNLAAQPWPGVGSWKLGRDANVKRVAGGAHCQFNVSWRGRTVGWGRVLSKA